MKNHKKHNKGRMRRNAANTALVRLPRAIARPPRQPRSVARQPVELSPEDRAALEYLEAEDSRGWRAIKALGGAAVTTVAGALLARQGTLPPKVMTGVISGLGAALALGAPHKTLRSIGLGAMSAAGGQLGLMLIDDEMFKREEKKDGKPPQVASGTQPSTPAKKPSNASDIPADALARAYERARLRMALASDAPN